MSAKRIIKRIIACVSALTIIVPAASGAYAANAEADRALVAEMTADYYAFPTDDSDIMSFGEYYELHLNDARPDCSADISGGDYTDADGSFTVGEYTADGTSYDNCLIWTEDGGSVTYTADIPETGLYCLGITYCPLASGQSAAELSLRIDGKTPYSAASRLSLPAVWEDSRALYEDSTGNQVRPAQVRREMWVSRDIGDPDGLFAEPLFFFLEKGAHEFELTAGRSQIAIAGIKLYNPEKSSPYEYTADAEKEPSRKFRIEGENALYKSERTLYPTYDNTNYLVSPSDPRKIVYNTIGAGSWKKSHQSVTWEIPAEEVGSGGWFRIGIKARQNEMRGFYSGRRIYIDGAVPCSEMDCVKFFYSRKWQTVSPETESGDDIYVYLSEGSHTITLEAVPGEIGSCLMRLERSVSELNSCYRSILMITGPTPDKFTDYYVHEKIPTLLDDLRRLSDELDTVHRDMEGLSGSSGSEAAVIEQMTVILDKCISKPLRIPSYLPRIKESLTSLSGWLREYRDQPLEVDYIEFVSGDEEFSSCKTELGKSIKFGISAFLGSFFEDYTSMNGASGEEAIEVWVSLGRDQAQIVRELAEEEFTREYGIPVRVKLVSGGVVEAALAGKEPDAALFLGGEFPVNLAARGLLADMSQMSGFGNVKKRFGDSALTQYSYRGGVYAIPLSRSFPMLFYRTDILRELGFEHPPETWDELMDMLPAIQRSYMSAGLVLPPANISPATEPGHTFAMLLLQNGLSYYNSDMTASALGETAAVQAFEQWTRLYTDYGFEQTYDAFSRFRTGEYPLVINNYTFANQLAAAAPEINGLWDFCPVPGTVQGDGSVSHAANSAGSGAVIFESSKHKDSAWQFIDWFTSADIQVRFGQQSEGLLGVLGRFDTANTEALSRLSWSSHELDKILAQYSQLAEIPVTPASYAVTRNIMNAFREVINLGENPRDTLLRYNLDINEEIEKRLAAVK